MSIQIYKPNKSNTGFGFSFSMGIDKKSQEPVLFVNGIAQYSWNNGVGTFHQNSENPDKTISVKFNEFECGAIIACMKGRYEWSTFHQNKENKTTIKFTPWDKSVKIQKFNPSKKTYDESTQVIPAFGMTITKNGNQTFLRNARSLSSSHEFATFIEGISQTVNANKTSLSPSTSNGNC